LSGSNFNKGISVIIPAYNEEDRIVKSLQSYIPRLKSMGIPYEIIVVTDGTDRTYDVAAGYSSDNVLALKFERKLGKGGALKEGTYKAKYDAILWIDADGSLHPDDMCKMIEEADRFDCVVASRWLPESIWEEKEPLFNRAVGRVFNFLVRGLLFLAISDTQCGAKLFESRLIKRVIAVTVVTNRTFDVAILYHLKKMGGSIREMPVRWRHDHETRMPIFRVIPIMFITLIGIRLMNLPIRRYVPDNIVAFFINRYARD
jgi:glycosyltransferase involved in cell wall biosynthesis